MMIQLLVMSRLGCVIEHACLVNQGNEYKKREGINYWNYYFNGIDINGTKYSILIDARSINNGENQFRAQRIEIKNKKASDHDTDF